MKELIVLAVILLTICLTVQAEESWEDICKRERAQGNTCIISKWICRGNSETQTMQIVRRYGSASRSRSRSPCHKSGGGGHHKKGKTCPKEDGYCVKSDGQDQRSGRKKIDGINRSSAEQQAICLAKCRAYPGATGCMQIWDKWNRGCYVYTSEVARGSGSGSPHHVCWVLSKCKGQRCTGQDDGCCTKETPCNLGEGDCDTDQQCAGSLVCGTDNCPWGDEDDCCKIDTIGCKNINTTANCEVWKELGYCKKYYVGFMKKNCCKTCREKGIKDTWEEECKKIRKKGNKCELSFGECKKGWKQQTMKITYPNGAWYKKWRMLPCHVTNDSPKAVAEVTGGCKDIKKVSSCEYWKELGYCTKYYVGFMKKNCCKTCSEKGIKDTWEEECKKERKKGNKCELSVGKCNKKWKKQTMKITHPDGSWFKKWRTLPCKVTSTLSEEGESSPDMGEGGVSSSNTEAV